MDILMMLISLISMIATVISCIIAVKAKNESEKILNKVKNNIYNTGNQKIKDTSVKNEGDINIDNNGTNSGTMAGIVTGGIKNGDRE
ncbi:hypothetical protein COJ57_26565 [Bacillus cereus]|uniref:hypothetical protein n=1 Tax=Bacillus cereus TaxID=1396 RepID=UPI000BF41ACC|nr:hypothetical protein [Bacillus cereus]PFI68966.1 hypothetical protein COI85_28570 [Bacillus cereus]PFN27335.1 hypothetical protein COJ57_26565 [Bacillus cereus]